MNAKHTPGPWIIHWNIGDFHRIIAANDPDMGFIGRVCDHAPTDGDMEAEAKANAKLIAAAPDILDALIRVRCYGDLGGPLADIADAAIEKATGGVKP